MDVFTATQEQILGDFLLYMEQCLNKLAREYRNLFTVYGDFNIDLLKFVNIPEYQSFYNFMTNFGFLPQIIEPTGITGNTEHSLKTFITIL